MQSPPYNQSAPKKATNVSINSDLLSKAKNMKINLSRTLEQALTEKLRIQKQKQWLEKNQNALNQYNQRIEKHGVFSDGIRKF